MFFDTTVSQSNAQTTNLSNNITIGSTGTDFGKFSPVTEASPEFKATNDLGLSASMYGPAGAVGMQKTETPSQAPSTSLMASLVDNLTNSNASRASYDGYTVNKTNDSQILIYIGVAITFVIATFSLFKQLKVK